MSIRKILYPLDFSGTATSNRIEGELKTIGVDRYRAFTLNFAPFFTNTLTIKERGKTKLLVRGTDYECLYFYPELTKLAAGKEVCGVVVITNAAIGIDLEVGYNTVGGHYAHSADVIQMAITALELDNRNVYWEDVIDTPTLFQPAPHMHDIGDVYGMEFQIDALVALREAILVGDNAVHQQIYDRIDNVVLSLTTMLNAHRADIANPHKTTAHQVNAYTREEIDTEIAAIMSDLADLEPRFQAIATTFTQIQQQYTSMTSSLAALSTRVGTVENEQSKFYLLLATINQTLAAHQVSIDAIYVEITALKAKDANLQTQIDGLKTRATNIEAKNVEQDDRLDDIESLNTTQNTRLDAIETKNTVQDSRLTAHDNTLTLHTNALGLLATRVTNTETKNSNQDASISNLWTNVTAHGNAIVLLQQQAADADTRVIASYAAKEKISISRGAIKTWYTINIPASTKPKYISGYFEVSPIINQLLGYRAITKCQVRLDDVVMAEDYVMPSYYVNGDGSNNDAAALIAQVPFHVYLSAGIAHNISFVQASTADLQYGSTGNTVAYKCIIHPSIIA